MPAELAAASDHLASAVEIWGSDHGKLALYHLHALSMPSAIEASRMHCVRKMHTEILTLGRRGSLCMVHTCNHGSVSSIFTSAA